jgi:hypothetical protein
MKHIDLGDAPAQLNGSLLTYQQGDYRYRVKLPTGLPLVGIHPSKHGRMTVVFSSWTKAVMSVTGSAELIESIFALVGGKGSK